MKKSISNAPRLSLSAKIFVGMGAGIFSGIFFGEGTQQFYVIGQVFIQLLQMSILPFLMLSLMTGLGTLNYEEALSLEKKAGGILLILWGIALVFL